MLTQIPYSQLNLFGYMFGDLGLRLVQIADQFINRFNGGNGHNTLNLGA